MNFIEEDPFIPESPLLFGDMNFNNDDHDEYNNNDNLFNRDENIFFTDYQNMNFGNFKTIIPGQKDELLDDYFYTPFEDIPKYKTEEPKSRLKTMCTEPKKLLEKKRETKDEIENENENEEDPKSDEERTKSTKSIKGEIFEIFKEIERKVSKGRNSKFKMGGKHTKFSSDNIIRKIKSNLFDVILRYINASMEEEEVEIYEKNLKKIILSKPFLLKINQEIIKNINVENNLNLLRSTLKEIFSNDVSKKMENHGLDKNKKLIEKIYEENKQKRAINILNMTFNQCLEQFRGSKKYKELDGLEKEFQNVINDLKEKGESEEYISNFIDLVNTFEEYYMNKKPRAPKKK